MHLQLIYIINRYTCCIMLLNKVRAVKLPPEGVNDFVGTRGIRVEDYVQNIGYIVTNLMIEKKTV